jgi:HlyD family secretion protein
MLLMLTSCGKKEKEFDATGTFEATEVTVSAKSTGELQRFDVTEGQEIDQNVVVGTIDAYQLKLQRQQLENTKEQLKANKKQLNATRGATNSKQLDLEKQVASIRQQIANAQRERQRYNELVNDGAVPRKQLDDINYQIKVLEKQLAATQEQIRSNNASLKEQSQGITAQMEGIDAQQLTVESQKAQLDDQIANSDIKAPITGSVLEKYVERGEYVTVGKPLFKMADTQNMFIRAYVTSAQLKDIKVGQQVKVFADYGNGQKKSYNGTVTWISSRSEFTPKTILTDDERADLVYAVKIAFKNDGYVKIGMYGEVKFQN